MESHFAVRFAELHYKCHPIPPEMDVCNASHLTAM